MNSLGKGVWLLSRLSLLLPGKYGMGDGKDQAFTFLRMSVISAWFLRCMELKPGQVQNLLGPIHCLTQGVGLRVRCMWCDPGCDSP